MIITLCIYNYIRMYVYIYIHILYVFTKLQKLYVYIYILSLHSLYIPFVFPLSSQICSETELPSKSPLR